MDWQGVGLQLEGGVAWRREVELRMFQETIITVHPMAMHAKNSGKHAHYLHNSSWTRLTAVTLHS